MKVAWVVPRWSSAVRGGAETAARTVAERLVAWKGWEVEVFTSRALDHFTWADELPEGTTVEAGVTVHRFSGTGNRFHEDPEWAGRIIHYPRSATLEEGRRWVEMQGPASASLIDALVETDAEVVVFTPYLFWPTMEGVPRLGRRAVLAAAAHDEPLIRLAAYRRPFASAGGFVYYTEEERELVEHLFRVAHRPHAVLGLGIETPEALPGPESLPGDLAGTPYVVCLGRVEEGKGSRMLARFFEVYKQRHPGPLRLVMAGPVTQRERYAHPDIVLAGPVDETEKWAILAGARAFVSPSPYESFSLVLMEAWSAGLPAMVNGRCAVTRGHAARSGGGLSFVGYPSFEAGLSRLLADPDLGRELGAAGRRYVEEHYAWPQLVDQYAGFLMAMAARA